MSRRRRSKETLKWHHVPLGILIALMIIGLPMIGLLIGLRIIH